MLGLLLFVCGFSGGTAISVMSLVNFTGHSTGGEPTGTINIVCQTDIPSNCDKLEWTPRRDNAAYIENCDPVSPPSTKKVRFAAKDMAEYHTCDDVTVHILDADNLLVKDIYWEGERVQCINYTDTDITYEYSVTLNNTDESGYDIAVSASYSEEGILDFYFSLDEVVIEGETMCNKSLIVPHTVPDIDIRFEEGYVICNASQPVNSSDSGLVCIIWMFQNGKVVAMTPKNDTSNALSSPFTKSSLAEFQCEAQCKLPGADGVLDEGTVATTKVISVNKVLFWVLIVVLLLVIVMVIVLCAVWWRKLKWGHKMRYWSWRTWSFYMPAEQEDHKDEQTTQDI